jgi:hypothetical protein
VNESVGKSKAEKVLVLVLIGLICAAATYGIGKYMEKNENRELQVVEEAFKNNHFAACPDFTVGQLLNTYFQSPYYSVGFSKEDGHYIINFSGRSFDQLGGYIDTLFRYDVDTSGNYKLISWIYGDQALNENDVNNSVRAFDAYYRTVHGL